MKFFKLIASGRTYFISPSGSSMRSHTHTTFKLCLESNLTYK